MFKRLLISFVIFFGFASAVAYAADQDAVKELIAKAKENDVQAQLVLSSKYAKGDGVAQNTGYALYWKEKAAKLGHVRAQYELGLMYADPENAYRDLFKAFYWYKQASLKGDADAQYQLGVMYATGTEVMQNNVRAYVLFEHASVKNAQAREYLDKLKRIMSEVEIDFANRLSLEEAVD